MTKRVRRQRTFKAVSACSLVKTEREENAGDRLNEFIVLVEFPTNHDVISINKAGFVKERLIKHGKRVKCTKRTYVHVLHGRRRETAI